MVKDLCNSCKFEYEKDCVCCDDRGNYTVRKFLGKHIVIKCEKYKPR